VADERDRAFAVLLLRVERPADCRIDAEDAQELMRGAQARQGFGDAVAGDVERIQSKRGGAGERMTLRFPRGEVEE
jgi:hypothetical protein